MFLTVIVVAGFWILGEIFVWCLCDAASHADRKLDFGRRS
jgi:hypothetical protein